jgi:methyl-accepting chemotaxis protein
MLGYVAVLIIFIAMALVLFTNSADIKQRNVAFTGTTLPALNAVEEAGHTLKTLHLNAYALYGTTINSNRFDQTVEQAKQQLDASLSTLPELSKVPLAQVHQTLSTLRQTMSQSSVDWDAARTQLGVIDDSVNKATNQLNQIKSNLEQQANDSSSQVQDKIESMRAYIWLGAVAIIAIVIVAFIATQKTMVEPMIKLAQHLNAVAQSLDLRQQLTLTSQDEVGTAAQGVNRLLSDVRQSLEALHQSVGTLLSSAKSMNLLSEESGQQMQQFSGAVTEMMHQIAQIESSITESAARSRNASEAASTGAEQVQQGSDNVRQTATTIKALRTDLENSAEMLEQLKGSGSQVSQVVKSIADIAEQTNLLALNAAIEAARAGESGRGFAVVADEVRNLAQRTYESTNQINKILEEIVNSISNTVNSMAANQDNADAAVEQVMSTVESLDAIRITVTTLSEENQQLAVATEANEQTLNHMRLHVEDVRNANEQLADSTEHTRKEAKQLTTIADTLHQASSRFKT